jgi:hypothetical protein
VADDALADLSDLSDLTAKYSFLSNKPKELGGWQLAIKNELLFTL